VLEVAEVGQYSQIVRNVACHLVFRKVVMQSEVLAEFLVCCSGGWRVRRVRRWRRWSKEFQMWRILLPTCIRVPRK
jgi:hypothetical protein